MKAAVVLAILLFSTVLVAASIVRHPQYTPDGFVYARMAALDAGYSYARATALARDTYEKTPLMKTARYRAIVEMPQPLFDDLRHVFANRILYPSLSGLFFPRFGVAALFVVSAASYVAFGLALLWLLLAFGRPWLCACLTILCLSLPLTRTLAASDLTDMLAIVWWTLALGAILHYMAKPNAKLLILLAVASALLALTRPAPYMVLIPAACAALVRRDWQVFAASFGGVVAYAVVAFFTQPYGIADQLRWEYLRRAGAGPDSFAHWYTASLMGSARYTVSESIRTVLPLLAILAGVYGLVRRYAVGELAVLFAAVLACIVAIPFNPVADSIPRVVAFPLVPVFAALSQAFISSVLGERRFTAALAR